MLDVGCRESAIFMQQYQAQAFGGEMCISEVRRDDISKQFASPKCGSFRFSTYCLVSIYFGVRNSVFGVRH